MVDEPLVRWLIALIISNISTFILAVVSWVKSAKMTPKEVRGADLGNVSKELSIADQFDALASKAAERAVNLQSRLTSLENQYSELKEQHGILSGKVGEQDSIIEEQSRIISEQEIRIAGQGEQIREQEELISSLRIDLNTAQETNIKLSNQLKILNKKQNTLEKRREHNE